MASAEVDDGDEALPAAAASVVDKPEADALEQSVPVTGGRVSQRAPHPDDVPEADWLEQSVVEPLDEDDR